MRRREEWETEEGYTGKQKNKQQNSETMNCTNNAWIRESRLPLRRIRLRLILCHEIFGPLLLCPIKLLILVLLEALWSDEALTPRSHAVRI